MMTEQEWRDKFAETLKRYMDRLGYKAPEIARRSDIKPPHVYKLLRAEHTPTVYTVTKLAAVLCVPTYMLTDFETPNLKRF